jgi:hypothetical protein
MVEARDVSTSELVAVGADYGVDYVYIYNNEFEWECFRLSGGIVPLDILSGKVALN